jgi:signal transduction histidine kinase
MAETPPATIDSLGMPFWRYIRVSVPALLFWAALVGVAAYLLYDRSRMSARFDKAALREFLEERRPNKKNLAELVDDYTVDPSETKTQEVEDQLDAMMEPLQTFRNGTPLFLYLFTITITFPERSDLPPLEWRSTDRPLRAQLNSQVRSEQVQNYIARNGTHVVVTCEYSMHAYQKVQHEEAKRQRWVWAVGALVLSGSLLAIVWVYLFLRRERRRELASVESAQALEHAENLRLEEQLRAQAAERAKEELIRKLLEQRLEAARQESRAAEAEKTALEMKSQLYASIGIMAGSYAHNIKNLLVRPNDLLARCLEANGMPTEQSTMLQEVQSTLGTVTERLQQILRTVRRDPNKTEMTRIDLNELVCSTEQTWAEMARDKWKLIVRAETAAETLDIRGDLSHLHQAIENLLFNARDATFEMRNQVREAARTVAEQGRRKQLLIDAASWKGQIMLRTYREGNRAVLEVRDNGIGMTSEVRDRCMQTHFSTKRDNALYEGYNAGMGLGLSFVVVVLEHHEAIMEIESEPEKGAVFRLKFPLASEETERARQVPLDKDEKRHKAAS